MAPHPFHISNGHCHVNGHTANGVQHTYEAGEGTFRARTSLLKRPKDDEIHDFVCVGFGPAALAIAIALHDTIEAQDPSVQHYQPKVRFLERQSTFAWHAGMLLPGAKMQISFVKDLATLRNPRSQFTFLNYLYHKNRLVQFINLGTSLPQRIEYEDYMKWCATYFDDVVEYGHDVHKILPGQPTHMGQVDHFCVFSRCDKQYQHHVWKARNVIIAVGGEPAMPKCLPFKSSRIIHSSEYATNVEGTYSNEQPPRSIAVLGAGQSAAEVFNNISTRFPNAKSFMIIRGSALRPSDDSPFVNEIFNPEQVDTFYSQDQSARDEMLMLDRGTNYGVVRLELLEHIYSTLYAQRIRYGDDENAWPHRILTNREVISVTETQWQSEPRLLLHVRRTMTKSSASEAGEIETLPVDLVIAASGYVRDAHEKLLKDLRHLMPGRDEPGKRWNVRRDYSVQFRDMAICPDAGVWLQGCNERTHGLSDTLLSVLAVRAGEMVKNVFGGKGEKDR